MTQIPDGDPARRVLEPLCAFREQLAAETPSKLLEALGKDPTAVVQETVRLGRTLRLSREDEIDVRGLEFLPSGSPPRRFVKSIPVAAAAPLSFEAMALWGLTDALVKRAGEELNDWALGRVRSELCQGVPSDAKTGVALSPKELFPEICALTERGGEVLFGGISAMRAAAISDMRGMPTRLPQVVATHACAQRAPGKECDTAVALSMSGLVVRRLVAGMPPAQALLDLGDPTSKPEWASAQFSLTSTPVSGKILRSLFLLESVARLEAGRLSLAIDLDVGARKGLNPEQLVDAVVAASVANAVSYWSPTSQGTATWDQLLVLRRDALLKGTEGLSRLLGIVPAFERLQAALDSLTRVEREKASPEARQRAVAEVVASMFRLVSVASELSGSGDEDRRVREVLNHGERLANCLGEKDYGKAAIELASLATTLGWNTNPQVDRLVTFSVGLAEAETVEAAQGAFEALMPPKGSYKRKRGGGFHVGANAYLGAYYGRERSPIDPSGGPAGPWAKSVGAWAPVGLQVGWGLKQGRPQHSLGILVHLIDVGALASYRVKGEPASGEEQQGDDVGSVPNVTFSQVFSPGIFLMWGLKNAPISIGVGYSQSPALRTVSGTENRPDSPLYKSAARLQFAVGLDIPIFP